MALSCSPTRSTNSWRSSPKAHSKRAHSKKDSEREPTEDFPPRASGCASKVRDHRLADRRKNETVVAERRFPVDGKRRSRLGWVAQGCSPADFAPRSTGKSCRRCAQRRIPPCSSAGHGRFEPLPGSVADDLRQRAGISPASCSRLDGPGAGQGVRRQDRNSEDALHRLEQVGQHTRTEHLQAVFLRKNQTGGGRGESWFALHRHHRSRIKDAAGGGARQIPAHLFWPAFDWWPLFGVVEFWHGSRGGYRHGHEEVS